MRPWLRKALGWLAVVALVAAGVLAWWRYGRATDDKAVRYETAPATRGRVGAQITANGTLSALVTVQVGSQVSGRIEKLSATFNSMVKKGDVIATLEPSLFQGEVRRAKANVTAASGGVAKANAELASAKRLLERQKALRDGGVGLGLDLDAAEAGVAVANANVVVAAGSLEQAKAALAQAETNLAYTTIKSPIDGIVISRSVDVGQTVAASLSAPVLFTIAEDLRKMQVDTFVAEADVGRLKVGMAATFTVDAFPGRRFTGTVREIRNAPQTVQNVVTYDAVIDVDNAALELKPGMTANVTVVVAEREDALLVPNSALRFRPGPELVGSASPAASGSGRRGGRGGPPGGGAAGAGSASAGGGAPRAQERSIWVLRDGAPKQIRIRTGITDGTYTEVVDGELAAGDEIVIGTLGGAADAATAKPASPGGGGLRRVF